MARFLHEDQIEGFLNGSRDESSDDEEQQDMPFPGQGTSILFPYESQSSSSSDEDVPLSNLRWKKKKFDGKSIPGVSGPKLHAVLTPAQYLEGYFALELMEQFALATNQYYMTETGH
ncbi:unnamed protein product [Parnassius apollo]|uniref:(apollo) hypothetical protein n=1 Tax=Parnassius apollo TaxID=110799 RepID=A0A8S3WL16_PARAO|nr:unnamed protein product [Parnassius apollo]